MQKGTIRIVDYEVQGCPVRTICRFCELDKKGRSTWILTTDSEIYTNHQTYTTKYEDFISVRHYRASIRRNFRLAMSVLLTKLIEEYLATHKVEKVCIQQQLNF